MNDNFLDLMLKEKGNIIFIICVNAHAAAEFALHEIT